jgi:hypothetical protein
LVWSLFLVGRVKSYSFLNKETFKALTYHDESSFIKLIQYGDLANRKRVLSNMGLMMKCEGSQTQVWKNRETSEEYRIKAIFCNYTQTNNEIMKILGRLIITQSKLHIHAVLEASWKRLQSVVDVWSISIKYLLAKFLNRSLIEWNCTMRICSTIIW